MYTVSFALASIEVRARAGCAWAGVRTQTACDKEGFLGSAGGGLAAWAADSQGQAPSTQQEGWALLPPLAPGLGPGPSKRGAAKPSQAKRTHRQGLARDVEVLARQRAQRASCLSAACQPGQVDHVPVRLHVALDLPLVRIAEACGRQGGRVRGRAGEA